MKKFLIKIVFFLIPLLLLMVLADFYITKKLKNNHEYPGEIEVWNDIYKSNINTDIAIYGSSRAWVHIDPKILEDSLNMKAYNFGIDGHNFWLQYLRHKEYLEYNKQPKLIIMSVDVFSLAKRQDLYELNQFLPYMLWNENIINATSSYKGFTFQDYYFPLFRYYGKIRGSNSILKLTSNENPEKAYRNNGFRGMERNWNNDLAKAKLNLNEYAIDVDSSSVNLFQQFLLECKSNQITVILVYTPEYIEGQNFVTNREKVINIYNDFSKKHNVLFLDYSNDEISQERDFFYNASHLNKKGSELFTRNLSQYIKALANKNKDR